MLVEPTNLATLAAVMARALHSYGHDSRALLREAGIDLAKLGAPGARVPVGRMTRLWQLALEATGDPCIGLSVGREVRPADFHGLGLSWMASGSLAGALQRLVRYHQVLSTAIDVKLVNEGDEIRLTVDHPLAVRIQVEAVDAFFTAVVRFCRELAGENFGPRRAEFVREDPERLESYAEVFRAPVRFSQDRDALVFDRATLAEPLPGGNEALAAEAAQIADRYLAELESPPTVRQVRAALVALLPSSRASQEKVARSVHMSVSTLQRRLRAEKTSYREIVDETREALALRYVGERKHSLSEIAFLLGFADQASFSRAFRRWCGTSPSRFSRDPRPNDNSCP